MDFAAVVQGRRIAVHCHAGLGRTGLAIACHLVYSSGMSAGDAVAAVRAGRRGALQTRAQVAFVHAFEQFVAHLRCAYDGEVSPPAAAVPATACSHCKQPPRTPAQGAAGQKCEEGTWELPPGLIIIQPRQADDGVNASENDDGVPVGPSRTFNYAAPGASHGASMCSQPGRRPPRRVWPPPWSPDLHMQLKLVSESLATVWPIGAGSETRRQARRQRASSHLLLCSAMR
jgi:hypothetical protein